MNSYLIDHILIAVSESEFQSYIDLSKSDNKFKYKKTITDQWKWEGIYVGLSDNIYLEIVRENSYPCRIGTAISLLGEEYQLLSQLKSKYPTWKFEQENAKKDNEDWYNGYFSSFMESKHAFLWFMEYRGKYKNNRKSLTHSDLPEIGKAVTVALLPDELGSFIDQAKLCGLFIEDTVVGKKVFDYQNRGFFVKEILTSSNRVFFDY
jgi:hypothetical protein